MSISTVLERPRPQPTSAPQTGAAPPDRPWLALAVVCLGVVLVVADNTIVNIALPTLSANLETSMGALQWLVDSYLLAFAGLLLPFGAIGDRIGRRRVMLAGLAVLGGASAAAATTDQLRWLIACRVVMGVGAALVFPATLSIVTTTFTDARQRRIGVAVWSATVGVGVIVGPVVGGFLLEHAWWGSVFLVNVPVAALTLLLTAVLVPESRDAVGRRLDPLGALLSFGAVTSLVFAIIEAPARGWSSPWTVGGVGLGAVTLAAFVWWERRHPCPVVPFDLLAQRAFVAPVVVLTLATMSLFGFVFVATQYFQIVSGLGAFESGLRYLPFAAALIGTAIVSPKLVARFGASHTMTAGMLALAAAMALTLDLDRHSGLLPAVAPLVVLLGVGMGLVTAPATDLLMAQVPTDRAGVGSGMNDTARQLGGAFGVAVLGSVFSSRFSSTLRSSLPPDQAHRTVIEAMTTSPAVAHRLATGPGGDPALVDALHLAFVAAMHQAALVGAAAALAGALTAHLLLGRQGR